MKIKEMRKKSDADLRKLITESERELREYRFAVTGSGKKNSATPGMLRKTIARAKTIMRENRK